MIHLTSTKAFMDEEQVDMVVPRLQRLLKPAQSFLDYAYKVFLPIVNLASFP